jgi:hypothetical protein
MEEYDAKRVAANTNAERLKLLRQARDASAASAEKPVVKKAGRRQAPVAATRKASEENVT